ncbi:hypothetical protein EGJ53_03795 [Pseudomonas fluorescens]|nr:hypothetical protein DMX04_22730 [Pseudomonas koreensis]RRW68860.1 hypothetical protein EGJ53_03795 [Pseudomonas fluorescens]
MQRTCGSWLASDGAMSVDIFLADAPLSLASQLPQGSVPDQKTFYHVAALALGRLNLPLSVKRIVPNNPPASLPRST